MIPDEIRSLVREWAAHPYDINDGSCREFARTIADRTDPNVTLLVTEDYTYEFFPPHMWITDGDLHYDAEEPEGARRWHALPIFQRTGAWEILGEDLKDLLWSNPIVRRAFDRRKDEAGVRTMENLKVWEITQALEEAVVDLGERHLELSQKVTEMQERIPSPPNGKFSITE